MSTKKDKKAADVPEYPLDEPTTSGKEGTGAEAAPEPVGTSGRMEKDPALVQKPEESAVPDEAPKKKKKSPEEVKAVLNKIVDEKMEEKGMAVVPLDQQERAIRIDRKKMEYRLEMADRFFAAGCFSNDCKNAEQVFTKIQAGAEMGLAEMQSMRSLYMVNGNISWWGAAVGARMRLFGYKLSYEDETPTTVTAVVTKGDEEYRESVDAEKDIVLQKSTANKFAPREKKRYYALSLIMKFHLPHLFGGYDIKEVVEDLPPIQQMSSDAKVELVNDKKQALRDKKKAQEEGEAVVDPRQTAIEVTPEEGE